MTHCWHQTNNNRNIYYELHLLISENCFFFFSTVNFSLLSNISHWYQIFSHSSFNNRKKISVRNTIQESRNIFPSSTTHQYDLFQNKIVSIVSLTYSNDVTLQTFPTPSSVFLFLMTFAYTSLILTLSTDICQHHQWDSTVHLPRHTHSHTHPFFLFIHFHLHSSFISFIHIHSCGHNWINNNNIHVKKKNIEEQNY